MEKTEGEVLHPPVVAVPPSAVLIELDRFAFSGRQLEFSVLQEVLGSPERPFTPALFSRYALHGPPAVYLGRLLKAMGQARAGRDHVLQRLEEARDRALSGPSPAIHGVFVKLMDLCRRRKILTGWMTPSGEDLARRVAQYCGFAPQDVAVQVLRPTQTLVRGRDSWIPLASRLNVPPSRCLALASSGVLCLAAISASMRCVACPDEFTAFDDFSGADEVLERWDEKALQRVTELLETGQ